MGMAHAQTSVNVPAPQSLLLCARARKVAGPAQSWAGRLPGPAPSRSVPRRPGFPRSQSPPSSRSRRPSCGFAAAVCSAVCRSARAGGGGKRSAKDEGVAKGARSEGTTTPAGPASGPRPPTVQLPPPAGVDASRGCARMSCALPAGGGGPGESVHRSQLLALTHRTAPTPSSSPYIRPDYPASGLPGTPFTDPDQGCISNHDRCPRP
ncbi:translation initiation factor IF-2-like [Leopardus geoffroyi]|uniref:translation initiation factor IF-2-like n=1 Tax=Leopardus geoffroyi TaxID=46844 RepID=UPI001E25E6F3|nr:translation initiation factor IF-2-like [Leopardus geoffroyi]